MDNISVLQGFLADEAASLQLGTQLASCLPSKMQIQLLGDLGAGKTTLTRGLLRGLGHAGRVKSPTYTLVESYSLASHQLHHFDLYRFSDPQEWLDAGFDEFLNSNAVCIIEWPDKASACLPPADLILELSHHDDGRKYQLTALNETGKQCLTCLKTRLAAN